MTTYSYITANTGTPEHHREFFGLLSFASNNSLGPVEFRYEATSAPDDVNKPVLASMVASLLPGDVLLIFDFVTVGNSTAEILKILSTLSRNGIKVYVVSSNYRLEDNLDWQVLQCAVTLVTKVEVDLTAHRISSTMAQEPAGDLSPTTSLPRTRKSRLDQKEDEIRSMLRDGATLAEIARAVETNRQTVADFINSRDLVPR
jgi:DNA invertase Pin-like site-specific DNA recombinase